MSNDTQLPAEIIAEIKKLQDDLTSIIILDDSFNKGYYSGMRTGIEAGATEYATKLHEAENEIEYKANEIERLRRIVSKHKSGRTYQEQKEVISNMRTLLEKFISRHEAGLLPDRFIYDEIKTFLDGTK